jgi:methionine synthase II (cobalamin-independent)
MFGSLLGDLPRPPLPSSAGAEALLEAVLRAQEEAGLEPVSDAGFGIGDTPAQRWGSTRSRTDRIVKQSVTGPYTSGGAEGALAAASALNDQLRDLVAAGCPYIEVHEPSVTAIGDVSALRSVFADAHRRLLEGLDGAHASLVVTGGAANAAGIESILAAPYQSLALDLIAGPDNWRLVAVTPGQQGIVCGALSAELGSDDRVEILLWAAQYAASTRGRGFARVGLATSSSLERLPWDVAVRKLRTLGEAARLAELPVEERRRRLDPRAVDIRSAALGRVLPPDRARRVRRPR